MQFICENRFGQQRRPGLNVKINMTGGMEERGCGSEMVLFQGDQRGGGARVT